MFAVIDIETTGLSPARGRITEIAVFLHNGEKVVEEFSTLINPEIKIPYRITRLTGINNTMVKSAPRFFEVAKKLVELTDGAVLVGHNVRFDYGFLRQEFLRLGYDFQRETYDTVKWSRKLFPGQPSYSLGKLCRNLGIDHPVRHRAAGDALATVRLFELLLSVRPEIATSDHNKSIHMTNRLWINNLPEQTGVYYFYDQAGTLIYVGKSVNIRQRVLSHLNNHLDKKELEMKNRLHRVRFRVTGSELVALLLESAEIKKHQPVFNRAQRRTRYNYGLYSFYDTRGYLNLRIRRLIPDVDPVYTYGSAREGKAHVDRLSRQFELCRKLTGLYDVSGPCFDYQMHQCRGACVGEESPVSYNRRVISALKNYRFPCSSFFVVDRGRHPDEKAVVKVENGVYRGFGFVPAKALTQGMERAEDYIEPQRDNREVRRIILSALDKKDLPGYADLVFVAGNASLETG